MSFSSLLARRSALFLMALTVAGSVVSITTPSGAALSPPAIPSVGAYFGSAANPRSGETEQDAIRRTEDQIGRTLAIDHQFYRWDEAVPTSHEAWDVSAGRIPFVSWKPLRKDGTAVPWTRINNGTEDAWITAQADRVRNFGHPLFMVFNHEPYDESKNGWGTPSDFIAAWRRVVTTFRDRGATNVAWVFVLTGYDYTISGRPDAFYPGSSYVDWIAGDPYNYFTRDGTWKELSQLASPFYTWGSGKGKPLMLSEWGTEEDRTTPGRKAEWFRNAQAWLASRPNIKAVVYFNSRKEYDWTIDTSSSSLNAFAAMGTALWFNLTPLPPSVTIEASADAKVVENNPGTNFGSSSTLSVDAAPREIGRAHV
jgi:hypothetical protein